MRATTTTMTTPAMSSRRVARCSSVTSPASSSSATTIARAMKTPTTVEYQRTQAKAMVTYFKERAYERDVERAKVFGWTPANEINNGRWTMFGLLVGMMTELATGVDFPDQIKLMISVLGIADVYE